MTLTDRELGTVLAALRQRQQEIELEEAVSWWDWDLRDIATDGGRFKALDVGEIDRLCERLNPGDRRGRLP